jgi:hypothetical protein
VEVLTLSSHVTFRLFKIRKCILKLQKESVTSNDSKWLQSHFDTNIISINKLALVSVYRKLILDLISYKLIFHRLQFTIVHCLKQLSAVSSHYWGFKYCSFDWFCLYQNALLIFKIYVIAENALLIYGNSIRHTWGTQNAFTVFKTLSDFWRLNHYRCQYWCKLYVKHCLYSIITLYVFYTIWIHMYTSLLWTLYYMKLYLCDFKACLDTHNICILSVFMPILSIVQTANFS